MSNIKTPNPAHNAPSMSATPTTTELPKEEVVKKVASQIKETTKLYINFSSFMGKKIMKVDAKKRKASPSLKDLLFVRDAHMKDCGKVVIPLNEYTIQSESRYIWESYELMDMINDVSIFMQKSEQELNDKPTEVATNISNGFYLEIFSMIEKYREANSKHDVVEIIRALCEIQHLVLRAVYSHGISETFEKCFKEVAEAHISIVKDGVVRDPGTEKILKPYHYKEPDLQKIIKTFYGEEFFNPEKTESAASDGVSAENNSELGANTSSMEKGGVDIGGTPNEEQKSSDNLGVEN